MVAKHRLSCVDTDFFQFHLFDKDSRGSLADAWTAEALARNVAVAPFVVGVGTARNTSAWLDLEIHEAKPELKRGKNWMRVVECSLELPSGVLAVGSPTCESEQVSLVSGCYRLCIHFGKQSIKGVHRYKVVLWQERHGPVVIL